jgi:hypothetical protein
MAGSAGSERRESARCSLHLPGNLTLSGYNIELWNHPFEVKRRRYGESNVVLTRELCDYSSWTDKEIRDRGMQMGVAAATIWKGPKHPPALSTDAEVQAPRFELRSRFWSGLRQHLIERSIDVPSFDSEKRWMHVSVPSNVRHVGVRLRYSINQSCVAIVLWFWRREARALWDQLRSSQEAIDDMVKDRWEFSDIPGRERARMKIEKGGIQLRDAGEWPKAFRWFEAKLPLVYGHVLPSIRDSLGQSEPVDGEETEVLSPEEVFAEICPNEAQRKLLASQLIRSIEVADAIAPQSWAVTLFSNGFRLNVGAVEALTFGDGEIRVLVHGDLSGANVRDGEISDCPYANAPQPSSVFQSPLSRYEEVADDLQAAHAAYVRGSAISPSGRRRRTAFARHHSAALVDHARKLARP